MARYTLVLIYAINFSFKYYVQCQSSDICDKIEGKRFYLEYGDSGALHADFQNNLWYSRNSNISNNRCTIEYVTCPSCVIEINFRYLNISRNCGRASVFDTCGCDYVWIYEPAIEDATGEQFCGRFIHTNTSQLGYISQTRIVAISFIYNSRYGHAFSLDYHAKRNRVQLTGHPVLNNMNNISQAIQSPFFPHMYPRDMSVEYIINCKSADMCRISLIFTDFLLAESSILEFFDWNGLRMYVIAGNIFRPPIIISTGPSMVIRFYANGASGLGFKASYSFILGNLDDATFKPNIACGGYINNLGGGITMMNMVAEGTKFFDCVWIIKPVENFLHRKTHLYVKVVEFYNFAGTTELVIRQGLTSTQPLADILRYPMTQFNNFKQTEHVASISKGFYIGLRGHFSPDSRLAIVFAAFNYKDCFGGSDYLCHNLRCIPVLLNCDGFDHCGDDSDELPSCSEDPKDHRQYSKIPNFLFPKTEPYSDITTATLVFLTCSFGLIGIILSMALLLYRVNARNRHQRQIQDHMETIHAILEEGVSSIEEEVVVSDNPPDYEAPPDYEEIINLKYVKNVCTLKLNHKSLSKHIENSPKASTGELSDMNNCPPVASTSGICPIASDIIPDSPPPSYENIKKIGHEVIIPKNFYDCPSPGPSYLSFEFEHLEGGLGGAGEVQATNPEDVKITCRELIGHEREYFLNYRSTHLLGLARKMASFAKEKRARCVSESQLLSASVNRNSIGIKRSFSTDDQLIVK